MTRHDHTDPTRNPLKPQQHASPSRDAELHDENGNPTGRIKNTRANGDPLEQTRGKGQDIVGTERRPDPEIRD